ncbi:MAG: TlpA family protein disulfide reductase, partial [Pedobacter sp.]
FIRLESLQAVLLILVVLILSSCKTKSIVGSSSKFHGDLDTLPKEIQNSTLKNIIDNNPYDTWAYYRFNLYNKGDSALLNKQYKVWMKKFPKVGEIPLNYSELFAGRPQHEFYLKQAVKINPKLIDGWKYLSASAYFNNDDKLQKDYLKKGVDANPENAEIFYRYATSFSVEDGKYEQRLLQLIEKFPNSEYSVTALMVLAIKSKSPEKKTSYYESIKNIYLPMKFNQATTAMLDYYSFLVEYDVEKTIPLLNDLLKLKFQPYDWNLLLITSKQLISAKAYIKEEKGKEALAILNDINFPYFVYQPPNLLPLLKAKAMALLKDKDVYTTLIDQFSRNPSVLFYKELLKYRLKQNKDTTEVKSDIFKYLIKTSKNATAFKLYNYQSKDSLAFSDLKGSVVLLTYWYPQCGPCRAEFPHFEKVLAKLKTSVKYISINIVPKEANLILPLMKAKKYSFIPLEEKRFRDKGNMDNMGAAPANFLIDKEGNLIFSRFRVNELNEDDFKLMMEIVIGNK